MAFTIPNAADAAFPAQARLFQADIDILAAGNADTGVVSGCAVTAQGTPDMTVAVAAGTVQVANGPIVTVASGNVTVGAADGTNPRIDLIYVTSGGVKSIAAGTAAANPEPPDLPASSVGLAFVYVPANDTDIDADQITDKRVLIAVSAATGAKVDRNGTDQTLTTATETLIAFTNETFDTDAFHDNATNNTRLTVPSGKGGKYLVQVSIAFANNTTGFRYVRLKKNGVSLNFYPFTPQSNGGNFSIANLSFSAPLAATDYIEVAAYQNSGGDLAVSGATDSTFFAAMLIGA